MAINPLTLLKAKERFQLFQARHPKIVPFFMKLRDEALEEGTVFEIKATKPDGTVYKANIRLEEEDLESIRMFLR